MKFTDEELEPAKYLKANYVGYINVPIHEIARRLRNARLRGGRNG